MAKPGKCAAAPKKRAGKRLAQDDPKDRPSERAGKLGRSIPPVTLRVTPRLPPKENSGFRMIELANGLKALLISVDPRQNKDPAWSLTFPDMNSTGNNYEPPSYTASVLWDVRCDGPHDDRHCCIGLPGCPQKTKCTASIMLRSGAYQDPLDFQGLAHFCEHVVHHGSELYPGEDDIRKFIQEHDGYSNAYTDKNVTNYHFQVNSSQEVLGKALKMYGDMLRAPLFPQEAITREVESVDNEYHLRRIAHAFQRSQLLNSVSIEGDHPMKQFMIGSTESLLHLGEARLQEAVTKFHRDYYYAENMRLVVRSPESLDFMQDSVAEAFSGIPRTSPSCEDANNNGHTGIPYKMENFNKFYTVKPRCNDAHELYLSWALPAEAWKDYRCKPLDYIGAVLGDEAPGGLAHYVRSKGWCLAMYSGCPQYGTARNDYISLFEMVMHLTQDGRAHVDEVITAVFSFIKLHQMKGAQQHIWEDLQRIEEAKFQSMKLGKSVDDTQRLSGLMHLFEDVEVVTGNALFMKYDKKAINRYLNELLPNKTNFMLFTLDIGRTDFQVEPFYETEYIAQDIPNDLMQAWQKIKPKKEFYLNTCANPFAVVPAVRIEDMCAINEIVALSPKMAVQYIPRREMASPQVNLMLQIQSGMDAKKLMAKKCVMDVWVNILKVISFPSVSQQIDMGVKFGIGFQFQSASLIFQIIGLNNDLASLMVHLLERFDKFEEAVTSANFDLCKELVRTSIYSTSVQTMHMATDLLHCLRFVGMSTHYDAYECLDATTYQDLLDFVREFKESMRLLCNVEGVVHKTDAVRVANALQAVRTRPLGLSLHGLSQPIFTRKNVGLGEKCLRVKSLQPKERMSTTVNYYELAPTTLETISILQLLNKMIQGKLFHELRTIEQLGYVVQGQITVDAMTTGYVIYICNHADKHSPCYIDGRIDRFLLKFYQDELIMRETQLTPLLQKHNIHRDPSFIQMFFAKYFLNGGPDSGYKKLSVQVVGCNGGACLCPQYKAGETTCRESAWLPPVGAIGKEKTPIRFACDRNEVKGGGPNKTKGFEGDGAQGSSGNSYFIRSIVGYHNSTD